MLNRLTVMVMRLLGRRDNIATIYRRQDDIAFYNRVAAERTSLAAEDIERAIDDEIAAIRATVSAAMWRMTALAGTGALSGKIKDALSKADKTITNALHALERNIDDVTDEVETKVAA